MSNLCRKCGCIPCDCFRQLEHQVARKRHELQNAVAELEAVLLEEFHAEIRTGPGDAGWQQVVTEVGPDDDGCRRVVPMVVSP